MKRKKFPVVNMGSALILTVFVILALVTFASLSLVTANSDYQFSRQIAKRSSDYYAACNKAQERLSQVDHALSSSYQKGRDKAAYLSALSEELKDDAMFQLDIGGEIPVLSYSVEIGEERLLSVTLELLYPQSPNEPFYRIIRWQDVSTKDWTPDNQLNLIQIP